MLRLSPARHGTDGFFVAVLQRRADPPPCAPASADPSSDPPKTGETHDES
jgi:hypothetical protein